MGDIDEQVDPQQWSEYVRKSQDSLRVIAEETGGIAVVNQNDFSKALKRIDAETSDYYVLGLLLEEPRRVRSAAGRSKCKDRRGRGVQVVVRARNTCSSRRRSRRRPRKK